MNRVRNNIILAKTQGITGDYAIATFFTKKKFRRKAFKRSNNRKKSSKTLKRNEFPLPK